MTILIEVLLRLLSRNVRFCLKLRNIDVASVVNWFSDRYPDAECWDKNEEGFSLTKENGIEFSLQDYIEFYQNTSQVVLGLIT